MRAAGRTGRLGVRARGRPAGAAPGSRCARRATVVLPDVHRGRTTTRSANAGHVAFSNSPRTRQKIGQNRSRASEPRTRVMRARNKAPGNADHLPSRVTRPRGFEPLTFGSVGGDSTCPRGLCPRGIACTDAFLEVTRAATRGHARTRFVPTWFPPQFPPMRVAGGVSRHQPRAPDVAGPPRPMEVPRGYAVVMATARRTVHVELDERLVSRARKRATPAGPMTRSSRMPSAATSWSACSTRRSSGPT
jgi:hypothetical protein